MTSLRNFAASPPIAGALEHRRQRLQLLVGGKHRAAHQPQQIGAFRDQRIEAIEIRLDGVDRVRLAGEIEQRGRVAARHAGYDGVFGCQIVLLVACLELLRKGAAGAGSRRKPLGIEPLGLRRD